MASKFVIVFCSLLAYVHAGVVPSAAVLRYTATPAVAAVTHHKVAYAANPAVDAVASTQQNVVRSFGGTVSQYSKSVDTPYSSVRKTDTRINNNVYTPAYEKHVTYAAPLSLAKTVAYEAPAPVVENHVYQHHQPATYTTTNTISKPFTYAAAPQLVQKSAVVEYAAAPVVSKTVYAAAPQPASLYTHAIAKTSTPALSAYAVAKPVATYSAPATFATTSYNHGPAATTNTHSAPGVSGYGSTQTVHYSPANMVSHMSFDGFGTHWGY